MADLLVIDPNRMVRRVLVRSLQEGGHSVREASSSEEALKAAEQENTDIVFIDPHEEETKIQSLTKLLIHYKLIGMIVVTGFGFTSQTEASVPSHGSIRTVQKPFSSEEIMELVEELMRRTGEMPIL